MSKASKNLKSRSPDDPPTHEEDPILSLTEAAEWAGVATSTMWKWVWSGALESVLLPNGMRKVRKSQVEAILRSSGRDLLGS